MRNKRIRPVRHLREMPEGTSRPQLILFNDGYKYAVKFKSNLPQRHKVLVNDYIVSRLARLLDLPVPRFRIVCVSGKFIRSNSIREILKPGIQFASEYIHNCQNPLDTLPPPDKSNIINRDQLAGMIVFDHWVSNVDRTRKNILLKSMPQAGYKFYMIDHGHSFGNRQIWTPHSLKLLPQKMTPNAVYKWCNAQIRSPEELLTFVAKIRKVPNQQISKVIESIPKVWKVSQEEKKTLFNYFIKAKRVLPKLIAEYIRENQLTKNKNK